MSMTSKKSNGAFTQSSLSNGVTNNTVSIGSTLGPGGIWNSNGNIYYTTDMLINGEEFSAEEFLSYMTEDEVTNILEKVELSNKSRLKNAVRWLVKNRHFSEDFLAKYLDYLYKNDILIKHMSDLNSRAYSKICLYYEAKEDSDADGLSPEGLGAGF